MVKYAQELYDPSKVPVPDSLEKLFLEELKEIREELFEKSIKDFESECQLKHAEITFKKSKIRRLRQVKRQWKEYASWRMDVILGRTTPIDSKALQ